MFEVNNKIAFVEKNKCVACRLCESVERAGLWSVAFGFLDLFRAGRVAHDGREHAREALGVAVAGHEREGDGVRRRVVLAHGLSVAQEGARGRRDGLMRVIADGAVVVMVSSMSPPVGRLGRGSAGCAEGRSSRG